MSVFHDMNAKDYNGLDFIRSFIKEVVTGVAGFAKMLACDAAKGAVDRVKRKVRQ